MASVPISHQGTNFDKALKNVIIPIVALLTFRFALKYFIGLWDPVEFFDWVQTVAAAATIVGIEIYLFRVAVLYDSVWAWGLGFLVAGVSVLGSLGQFETGVQKNNEQSRTVVEMTKERDGYQAQADSWRTSAKDSSMSGWANVKAEKWQAKADSVTSEIQEVLSTGATGSGNALFRSLASDFGGSHQLAAKTVNRYTAIVFEAALIFLTIFSAHRDKQAILADLEKNESAAPNYSETGNSNSHSPTPSVSPGNNSGQSNVIRMFTSPGENILKKKPRADGKRKKGKQLAMEKLIKFLQEHPDATVFQMAEHIGRSKSSTEKYLAEIRENEDRNEHQDVGT